MHDFHGTGDPPPTGGSKYHVRVREGKARVCLDYRLPNGWIQEFVAVEADDLAETVAASKAEGGSFHLDACGNIVCGFGDTTEKCLGRFERPILFSNGAYIVTTDPPDPRIGDVWLGPPVGRHYAMSARDIRYGTRESGRLANVHSARAEAIAKRLARELPRWNGARIYVNHHGHAWAPLNVNAGERGPVYLGRLRGFWYPEIPCPS